MNLKKFGIISTLFFASSIITTHSIAENHHAETPSFKSTEVATNLWMLQGKGGNVAIMTGPQGLLMVDDDYKEMSPALLKEVKLFGGLEKLTYIINTHWHGDHTGGNFALGSHAHIVAHDNVRTRLLNTQEIKLFKMVSEPYPEKALPNITYSKVMTLHMNDEEIKIIHYANGHTDGDSIVFFKKANVIHMGDHHFSGFFPFVDIDHGGNVLNMAKNVKEILATISDTTKVIPGHGPLSSKSDLQDFHDMLIGTSAEVQKMKDQGLTLEQMKAKGLSKQWDSWTDGFLSTDVWIGIVYASLLSTEHSH
ncbi:MAG: MBL fold metallo-hydrolase [Gammaproteobacteria bacterium]|nr:MBL fold metallo-hydrolase [Gammaproteobacteria bacterium]